jgi:hypothetical protein
MPLDENTSSIGARKIKEKEVYRDIYFGLGSLGIE